MVPIYPSGKGRSSGKQGISTVESFSTNSLSMIYSCLEIESKANGLLLIPPYMK